MVSSDLLAYSNSYPSVRTEAFGARASLLSSEFPTNICILMANEINLRKLNYCEKYFDMIFHSKEPQNLVAQQYGRDFNMILYFF